MKDRRKLTIALAGALVTTVLQSTDLKATSAEESIKIDSTTTTPSSTTNPIATGAETTHRTTTGPTTAKPMAKSLVGTWQGKLSVNGMGLPLVFHFASDANKLTGTLDSPAQGASGITIDSVDGTEAGIKLTVTKLQMTYAGSLSADKQKLEGTFEQHGIKLPLSLARTGGYVPPKRPQEPKAPFPYRVEEVTFADGDVKLAGTITRPDDEAQHPAIVLVHGSGPHKRDEPIFMHKPFLLLADYLTRRGYVVLRYDKRGVGNSTGSFATATTMDFANDADAALQYLKSNPHVDPKHIGMIGHSEGADIASIVAGRDADCNFIVFIMAGSALPGDKILVRQVETLSRSKGLSDSEIASRVSQAQELYATIKSEPNETVLREKLQAMTAKASPGATAETSDLSDTADAKAPSMMVKALASPWYRFFIGFDPCTALAKVTCPVLALNGDKDVQVVADENLPLIESTLKSAGNTKCTIKKLTGLNHLFQSCKTGLPSEYEEIEETLSPSVLTVLADWLAQETGTHKESLTP